MNRLTRIIIEEISAIKKNKDEEIFNYNTVIENAWYEPKKNAQDFQKIHFDFENDESTGQKKRFFLKKNLRKNQPVKYEIQAELYIAGGDWEMGVMYFRIEFTRQYGILSNKYCKNPEYVWDVADEYGNLKSGSQFVLIPPVEAGNKLVKGDNDNWFAYQNNNISAEEEKKAIITDNDKKKRMEMA